MLPKINPSKTINWNELERHFASTDFDLRTLFKDDENRFEKLSIKENDFIFDYSKNLINQETLNLLFGLAKECKLEEAIEKMFSGKKINETEKRAVLHIALRDFSDEKIMVDEEDIKPKIKKVLDKMEKFTHSITSGQHKGFTGKPITDVVNIGIGGSALGNKMVCSALKKHSNGIETHFVSNVDAADLENVLEKLNPETTLFIIASKSFSTVETLTNANSAKKWFLQHASEQEIAKHFVAISTNKKAVNSFGISDDFTFGFWDWVGGRYSLWSAIGLSISLSIGFHNFKLLLEGAHSADQHFRNNDFSKNVPIIMALLGIWYRNFFASTSYAILPYAENLKHFPTYLQQIDMESNGKSVDRNGSFVNYETGPIVFGEAGTNSQHSFFQLIHQGTEMIPADFIAFIKNETSVKEHTDILSANCFAQTEALAFGRTKEEVINTHSNPEKETLEEGMINHKIFMGNSPTNTFLFKELTPFTLGKLIAFYEHKIFVQGVIWNIFSFDQFGVELGKILAQKITQEIQEKEEVTTHDSSTNGLINYYKENQ